MGCRSEELRRLRNERLLMNQATSQNPCRLVPLYRQAGNSDAANRPAGYRPVDFRISNRNAGCPPQTDLTPTQRFGFDNHFPDATQ